MGLNLKARAMIFTYATKFDVTVLKAVDGGKGMAFVEGGAPLPSLVSSILTEADIRSSPAYNGMFRLTRAILPGEMERWSPAWVTGVMHELGHAFERRSGARYGTWNFDQGRQLTGLVGSYRRRAILGVEKAKAYEWHTLTSELFAWQWAVRAMRKWGVEIDWATVSGGLRSYFMTEGTAHEQMWVQAWEEYAKERGKMEEWSRYIIDGLSSDLDPFVPTTPRCLVCGGARDFICSSVVRELLIPQALSENNDKLWHRYPADIAGIDTFSFNGESIGAAKNAPISAAVDAFSSVLQIFSVVAKSMDTSDVVRTALLSSAEKMVRLVEQKLNVEALYERLVKARGLQLSANLDTLPEMFSE